MSTLKLKNIKALEGTGADVVNFTATDQANFSRPMIQPGGFMFRNKIINGNFDIWQRSTSQTANGYGSADRWFVESVGSTKTASRQNFALGQTDVPDNPSYFMRNVVTSVAGAGNYAVMYQRIEGVQTFSGKSVTLSFWAKSDAAKNIAVEFVQNFGSGGTPSAEVTSINPQLINLTTSWAKYTVTVTLPSVSGKTLGTDDNSWMSAIFWFDAGSDWDSRTASLGQQSGTFDIAQVQLEEGAAATPFEMRPLTTEFSLCERYYAYWNPDSTAGTVSNKYGLAGTGWLAGFVTFRVKMRTTPTNTLSQTPTYTNCSALIIQSATPDGYHFRVTVSANGAFRAYSFNVASDAEL